MTVTTQPSTIDGLAIRKDFPIFQQVPSEGRLPLVFLDSAASSQRPAVVIDTVSDFYQRTNANIPDSGPMYIIWKFTAPLEL